MKHLDLAAADWTKAWRVAAVLQQRPDLDLDADDSSAAAFLSDSEVDGCNYDLECPMCETSSTVRQDASGLRSICLECGLVVQNYTDERPEWTTAGQDKSGADNEDPARGDAINPLMPHASMNTDIVPTSRMQFNQYKMMKLNRWGAQSPMERSLAPVFNKIERACARHRPKVPPNVVYTTKVLFRRVYEINLKKHQSGNKREGLRGTKRDGLIAACLYMAFKINDLYWKKNVVAAVFEVSPAEIRRGISIFWDLVKDCDLTENLAKVTGVKQYIQWYYAMMQLPRCFATFAVKLYKKLHQLGVGSSKQPQSIAAWCLWAVCQVLKPELNIEYLAERTDISKATILDVDRLTQSFQRIALIEIFTEDFCCTLHIENVLTREKMIATARAFCGTQLVQMFPLWPLAAFSVYFVFTVNDVAFNEHLLLQSAGMTAKMLLHMCKVVIPFRDAIISDCVGSVHRAAQSHASGSDHQMGIGIDADRDYDYSMTTTMESDWDCTDEVVI